MEQTTLHKYFRGEASIEEEKAIMEWAGSSQENERAYLNERMLFDVSLFAEEKKREKKGSGHSRLISILKWPTRIAATLILLVSSFYLIKEYEYTINAGQQTVTVPAGQRAMITLADGTNVWLNAQSTLTYSPDFGRDNRNVELDGEAYFEVVKNKNIPFNVLTQQNRVEVIGTTFNVAAYKNTNIFEASLVEGLIDIYSKESKKPITRLSKNQQFRIEGRVKTKSNMKSTDALLWREGLYCFDDTPFQDILKKLEIHYGLKIAIKNAEVLNYHCTGKFKEQDGLEHILRVIQKDNPFNYRFDEGKNTVTIW